MAAFATPTKLTLWLGVPDDPQRAGLMVDAASAAIRAHCGWYISEETTSDTFDSAGGRDLWLPTRYLTDVSAVVEDDVTLAADQYEWTRSGRLTRAGRWAAKVEVTFTHGYRDGHPMLGYARAVCLSAAARGYQNPAGNRSEQQGGVSWTAAGAGEDVASVLTAGELDSLAPLALHGVA